MISPNSNRKLIDKLTILYAYYIYNSPAKLEIINKIMLKTGLIDYFSLVSLTHELIADGFIEISDHLANHYMITNAGKENINALIDKIQAQNKEKIYNAIVQNKDDSNAIEGVVAQSHKISENNYMVNLKLLDNDEPLIEINLKAPTNSIAQKLVNTWNNNAIDIFRHLIDEFNSL